MQPLPHLYNVSAHTSANGPLNVSSKGLTNIEVAPPAEFGGPGNIWSPETIFMSALSSCYLLSFKAVSRASKLNWISIKCESIGTLDTIDGNTHFTQVVNKVTLEINDQSSPEKALTLLKKAEHICLISKSVNAKMLLESKIIVL